MPKSPEPDCSYDVEKPPIIFCGTDSLALTAAVASVACESRRFRRRRPERNLDLSLPEEGRGVDVLLPGQLPRSVLKKHFRKEATPEEAREAAMQRRWAR